MALPSYIILNIFSRANLNFSAVYRETGNVQSSCLHSCHPKNPTVHSCYRLNKDRTPWKQRYLPTASTCLEEKKYELFCVITLLYYLSCQLILYVNNKPISAQQILEDKPHDVYIILAEIPSKEKTTLVLGKRTVLCLNRKFTWLIIPNKISISPSAEEKDRTSEKPQRIKLSLKKIAWIVVSDNSFPLVTFTFFTFVWCFCGWVF